MVRWRLPNKSSYEQIQNPLVQRVELNEDILRRDGFLFHPFDAKHHDVLLFSGNIEKNRRFEDVDLSLEKAVLFNLPENKKEYTTRAIKILNALGKGSVQKVVLARKIRLQGKIDATSLFNVLCNTYPDAFVYSVQLEDKSWVGASPELFLKRKNNIYSTVALAGTRVDKDGEFEPWTKKEDIEQALVKDFILDCFRKAGATNIQLGRRKNRVAGQVRHLINEISVENHQYDVVDLIKKLHPTPAVAGLPKTEALEWINANEGLDREYYAGFLGPIGKEMSLFVNLRCLKKKGDELHLYVGGGYTADSVVEDEWQETKEKSKTILNVLKKTTI